MIIGAFEIDLDDGEVRFRTSIDLDGLELSDEALENLFGHNFHVMGTYLPAIVAVSAGKSEPADAIATVEDRSLGD